MSDPISPVSPRRRLVAGVAAAFVSLALVPFAATLLRQLGPDGAPRHAWGFTLFALAAAVASLFPGSTRRAAAAAALVGFAAAPVLGAGPGSFAIALVAPLAAGIGRWASSRWSLPLPAPRRALAIAWVAVSLLGLAQAARLSTYVHDPEVDFVVATTHPFWHKHGCLPAYLHGAELARRGEPNLYDAAHYPGLDPLAEPNTAIAGMVVEDPFQYPPPFLLLPGLAVTLTHDLDLLRTGWFAAQIALYGIVFVALAAWLGGRAGRTALALLPATFAAFPVLYNFQFGQFHLAAVALAVAGMVAVSRGRDAVGGGLLAFAILAKMFPAVLLPWLAVRRRWRALGWTAVAGALATLATVAVFGIAPFTAFFDYHLPRLGNGEAFAFDLAWPELADLVLADNQGVYGMARKLGFDRGAASTLGRSFGIVVLLLAALAAWRFREGSRWAEGSAWLALLGLGSLASPGAWGDYVPSTAVWLLALLAPLAGFRGWRWLLAAAIPFEGFLIGTFPIGDWAPMGLMIPLSLAGVAAMLALFGAVLLHPGGFSVARESRPDDAAADPALSAAA